MSTDDKMSIDERRKYLGRMKKRYAQATRKERGQLLDEMEAVTELHRKSRRKQRGCTYGPEVDDTLRVISESVDYICPERLTPNLVWMAKHLAAHGEIETTPELLAQLGQISVSTVRRRQDRIRQDQPRLPHHRADTSQEAADPLETIDLPTGDETILLVEDDERVRDMARHILQDQGYTVLEARDSQKALQVSARHPGPIHLLLTDIVMPGMSGRVVAERLSQVHPGLKVLFISGYTDDETILRHGVLESDGALLQKPFGAVALTDKVRQALNEPKGGA